jgi:tetratricopeptide (TPR) repeat protein
MPPQPPGSGGGRGFLELLAELGARPTDETEDVGSHYDLGLAYKEMGLLDAAIGQLHDALAAGDHPLASLEVLGECYLEREEHDRACRVLERATELASSDTELLGVRYLLARCEEAMGERDAARESYGRVVAIEPSFRDAAERLGRL